MPKNDAVAIDVVKTSRVAGSAFMKAIFDGLIYDGFRFPTFGADGCIGNFCISKGLEVSVPGANDKLALHLNFGCGRAGFEPGHLNLKITHFHLTARAKRSQLLINDSGPSALTASASIHINCNGDWGRDANIGELATEIGVTRAVLLGTLINVEGYNAAYMRVAVAGMQHAITHTVGVNCGATDIDWSTSDSTFKLA